MFDTPLCSTTGCLLVGMGAALLRSSAQVSVAMSPKCRTLPHSAEQCRRLAARCPGLPNSAAQSAHYCRLQLKIADFCRTFVRFLFMACP
jgi:hypothetical protein